jgi:hypothetical protein
MFAQFEGHGMVIALTLPKQPSQKKAKEVYAANLSLRVDGAYGQKIVFSPPAPFYPR